MNTKLKIKVAYQGEIIEADIYTYSDASFRARFCCPEIAGGAPVGSGIMESRMLTEAMAGSILHVCDGGYFAERHYLADFVSAAKAANRIVGTYTFMPAKTWVNPAEVNEVANIEGQDGAN